MKKILCGAMAFIMVFALTACSNNNNTADSTTAVTTSESTDEIVDTSEPEVTEAPESESAEDTSETEIAAENNGEVTASSILQTIRDAYGDTYLPNSEIPAEMLESNYGLTSDLYVEVAGEMPMISTYNDTVIIVKAAEGKIEDVKAALEAARENFVNDTMQYPMNVAKTNASKVITNGDYAAFLMVGAIDDREDITDDEAAAFAEEQVQIAVDAFNANFSA